MPELPSDIKEIIDYLSVLPAIGLIIALYVITQMVVLLSEKDRSGIVEGFAIFTIIVSGFAIFIFLKRLGIIP